MPMTGEKMEMKKGRRKKLYTRKSAAPAVVDLLTSKCPRLHQRRSSISTLWKIALVHPLSCQEFSPSRETKHGERGETSPQLLITQEKREAIAA
jgi:hypothetical protein